MGLLGAAGAVDGAGAYDLLATTAVVSDVSSVTFDNLDTLASDYKHLQIRLVARSSRPDGTVSGLNIRMNNDSTNSYASHWIEAKPGNVTSQNSTSRDNMFAGIIPGNTAATPAFGPAVIEILDFASSSKNTTIKCISGMSDTGERLEYHNGLFANTAAITEIQLYTSGQNFLGNSRFSLYGIKG